MRCYICDREDDLIALDKVRGEFGCCTICQAIVEETLQEFDTEIDTEGQSEVDNT